MTQGNLAQTVKKYCIAHGAQKREFPNFFRLWSEALEIGEFLGELLVISWNKFTLIWWEREDQFTCGVPSLCPWQTLSFPGGPLPTHCQHHPWGDLYKEFIYCPKNASVVRFVYLTLILNGQEGAVAFAWDDLNTWEKIVGWPLLSEEKQLSFLFSFFICRDFDFQHFDILLNTVKIKRIGIKAGMTRCWIIVVFKWSEGLVCSFLGISSILCCILSTRYTHLYWEERSFAAWSAGRQVGRRQNT